MYLLTSTANVQTVSGASDFQTLLKYSLSALEVDTTHVIPVNILANTTTEILFPSLETLMVLAIKSANPVELSLKQESAVDVFTGLASQFQLFIRPEGAVIQHVKIRSTVAGLVEITAAGRFT